MEHAAKVVSIGESLDIVKDVGGAHDVDDAYHVAGYSGTHGIGHVRLATESDVTPDASHPFWATGFADVAIVHNGQITNYWKMRRRLEKRGMEFNTDNDSELIAVYLADKLDAGRRRSQEALETSIADLDGTFSFLVSTKDEIGYAKDNLAAKPMVMYEDDELVAIASEEVSLNRLFPGQVARHDGAPARHLPHMATIDLAAGLRHRREQAPARLRRAGRGRRRRQPGRPPPHRCRPDPAHHGARPRVGRLLLRRAHRRPAVRGRRATSAGASRTTCTKAPSSCAETPARSRASRSAGPTSSSTGTSARAPGR